MPASAHAGVSDHEQVGALVVRGTDDRGGDIRIDPQNRAGAQASGVREEQLLGALVRPRDDLDEHELSARALRLLGRPRHGLSGCLRAVGRDDDLDGSVFHHDHPWGARGTPGRENPCCARFRHRRWPRVRLPSSREGARVRWS
jgi:hypothetical protein